MFDSYKSKNESDLNSEEKSLFKLMTSIGVGVAKTPQSSNNRLSSMNRGIAPASVNDWVDAEMSGIMYLQTLT